MIVEKGLQEPIRSTLYPLLDNWSLDSTKGQDGSVEFLKMLIKKERDISDHAEKVLYSEHFDDTFYHIQQESLTRVVRTAPEQLQQTIGHIMHFIVVGKDVAYLRENIDQITGGSTPSDDFEQDYYNRVQPFVARTCFGYLDETDPECIDHCDFQHKCAEKRQEILRDIAEDVEEQEYEMDFDARMAQTAQDIDNMKSNDLGSF